MTSRTGQILAAGLMLCLSTGAAMAQDLRFSMSDTQTCLGNAGNWDEARSCAGASASACINANALGSTTVGMGGCLGRELQYWDDRLNGSYQVLMAQEISEDAEFGSANVPKQAKALRDMQRAWIAYRDAACDYARAQWGGGTGGGPATLSCLMRLTADQALYLESIYLETLASEG